MQMDSEIASSDAQPEKQIVSVSVALANFASDKDFFVKNNLTIDFDVSKE